MIAPEQPIASPSLWIIKQSSPTRRRILQLFSGMSLMSGGIWAYGHSEANSISYRQESINMGVPELDGFKILFPTDVHIGGNINAIARQVGLGMHTLLDGAHSKNTVIIHGGDFVSKRAYMPATTKEDMKKHAPHIFAGLQRFKNVGVIGNHDEGNADFGTYLRWKLEHEQGIDFLESPEDVQYFEYNGHTVALHGLHTLGNYLPLLVKSERDALLDRYIEALNNSKQVFNICALHNPDGLHFLLERLKETGKKISKKTLFLAGHAHGWMVDIPLARSVWLLVCGVEHGRYKGWYGPEWDSADTGDWQMYVSTGVGNSPYHALRLNAEPEVVCFQLQSV
jgi:predicted MPP superfamily phosphohydrolase